MDIYPGKFKPPAEDRPNSKPDDLVQDTAQMESDIDLKALAKSQQRSKLTPSLALTPEPPKRRE